MLLFQWLSFARCLGYKWALVWAIDFSSVQRHIWRCLVRSLKNNLGQKRRPASFWARAQHTAGCQGHDNEVKHISRERNTWQSTMAGRERGALVPRSLALPVCIVISDNL